MAALLAQNLYTSFFMAAYPEHMGDFAELMDPVNFEPHADPEALQEKSTESGDVFDLDGEPERFAPLRASILKGVFGRGQGAASGLQMASQDDDDRGGKPTILRRFQREARDDPWLVFASDARRPLPQVVDHPGFCDIHVPCILSPMSASRVDYRVEEDALAMALKLAFSRMPQGYYLEVRGKTVLRAYSLDHADADLRNRTIRVRKNTEGFLEFSCYYPAANVWLTLSADESGIFPDNPDHAQAILRINRRIGNQDGSSGQLNLSRKDRPIRREYEKRRRHVYSCMGDLRQSFIGLASLELTRKHDPDLAHSASSDEARPLCHPLNVQHIIFDDWHASSREAAAFKLLVQTFVRLLFPGLDLKRIFEGSETYLGSNPRDHFVKMMTSLITVQVQRWQVVMDSQRGIDSWQSRYELLVANQLPTLINPEIIMAAWQIAISERDQANLSAGGWELFRGAVQRQTEPQARFQSTDLTQEGFELVPATEILISKYIESKASLREFLYSILKNDRLAELDKKYIIDDLLNAFELGGVAFKIRLEDHEGGLRFMDENNLYSFHVMILYPSILHVFYGERQLTNAGGLLGKWTGNGIHVWSRLVEVCDRDGHTIEGVKEDPQTGVRAVLIRLSNGREVVKTFYPKDLSITDIASMGRQSFRTAVADTSGVNLLRVPAQRKPVYAPGVVGTVDAHYEARRRGHEAPFRAEVDLGGRAFFVSGYWYFANASSQESGDRIRVHPETGFNSVVVSTHYPEYLFGRIPTREDYDAMPWPELTEAQW